LGVKNAKNFKIGPRIHIASWQLWWFYRWKIL